MKVVKPIEITEAVFTASSVAEPDLTKGEVEWTDAAFIGKSVPEIVNGEALTTDGAGYSVLGWNTSTLVATIYIYDSSFVYQSSLAISSGLPYVSGDKRDVCFDGNNYWFSDGDQISKYNTSWGYAGEVINIETEFTNAYVQTICSDGVFLYATVKDFTDATYKIAKYKLSDNSFVESKSIQENLEIKLKGSVFRDGVIKHFARRDYEGESLNVYSTDLSLVGFQNIATVSSLNPSLDIGLEKTDSGYITLNPDGNLINQYNSGYNLEGLYKVDDRAIKISTHKLYQCTLETADDPEIGVNKIPQTWVEVGPTNKWAIFDDKKSTPTVSSSPYTIQLVPGVAVDSMAATNISGATEVQIIATSASAGEVYNRTIQLLDIDSVTDFYNYFFYELEYVNEFTIIDIPIYNDLTIDITFTGSEVSVGRLATGRKKSLGELLVGASSDRIDYSRSEFDEFGELTYVARPIVKYSTYPVAIEKKIAPSIERYLDSIKGVQAVWIGDIGNDQFLTTFGAIERSPLVYDNLSIVEYQIKVRGSI